MSTEFDDPWSTVEFTDTDYWECEYGWRYAYTDLLIDYQALYDAVHTAVWSPEALSRCRGCADPRLADVNALVHRIHNLRRLVHLHTIWREEVAHLVKTSLPPGQTFYQPHRPSLYNEIIQLEESLGLDRLVLD